MEYRELADDVFVLEGFMSKKGCQALIDLAESRGFDEAPINTVLGPQRRTDIRDNERVMMDVPELAAKLWQQASPYMPSRLYQWEAVGLNERLRFYRYQQGQRFVWHRDGAFERPSGERSHLTFMVYLNGGFEGGETRFTDCSVKPEPGLALVFHHRLLHQGDPVVSGVKYVLRTDVMYEPPPELSPPIFA